jgi:ATP-binding cassette, subfamily B, bacterial
MATMLAKLRKRQEWAFAKALWATSPRHAFAWWAFLLLRGTLTAVISIAVGWLVSSVTRGVSLTAPLIVTGIAFMLLLVLQPIHQVIGANLGSQLSAYLYDKLMAATISPPGIGHLERPELMNDLSMARDFDLGMMGPPLDISMDFIVGGLLDLVIGVAAGIVLAFWAWWAPIVLLIAWTATHYLLRESGVWKDRNNDDVRSAQRHAEYSYRLAVDASPAKELRLFGMAGWVLDRFITTRTKLYELQYEATRIREKPLALCLLVALGGNLLVFWRLGAEASSGQLSVAQAVVFLQAAAGMSALAFGGLNWALDGVCAPIAAVLRLEEAMAPAGHLPPGTMSASTMPAKEIRFRDVSFAYPAGDEAAGRNVLERFDLTIPAGTSLAIVGQNGAGKTTLAKLLCRLYDPTGGVIEIDGVDLRELDIDDWRSRVTAVFQDFIRFDLPLRTNVAPRGAPDDLIEAALADAGGSGLATLDQPLAKGYENGTDLSGGQWQRIALARALAAVRQGAGLVLLDEPTAQLDVRGEAEIFERVLAATRQCTTVIISHRFSTVRQADRIAVVEHGAVIELGSHDELMALDGRYRTMFDLQASRFTELDDAGEEVIHERL